MLRSVLRRNLFTGVKPTANHPNWQGYVVKGGQHGDEGKGKLIDSLGESINNTPVTVQTLQNWPSVGGRHLLETRNFEMMGIRDAGGANAGHTIVIPSSDGSSLKFKTRACPSAVKLPGCLMVMGPHQAIHYETLAAELESFADQGITDVHQRLVISKDATVITDAHIQEDIDREEALAKTGKQIGTTRNGIGVAVAHQALRDGPRVQDDPRFANLGAVVDTRDMFMSMTEKPLKLLFEGAQSTLLDGKFGGYPYTTATPTMMYNIYSLGLPMNFPLTSIMCMKAYHTGVGFHPSLTSNQDLMFDEETEQAIADAGGEYGTVTGRRRLCVPLNLDLFAKEAWMMIPPSGKMMVVFNKYDVLEVVSKKMSHNGEIFGSRALKVIYRKRLYSFESMTEMRRFTETAIETLTGIPSDNIKWSGTPMADPKLWE